MTQGTFNFMYTIPVETPVSKSSCHYTPLSCLLLDPLQAEVPPASGVQCLILIDIYHKPVHGQDDS